MLDVRSIRSLSDFHRNARSHIRRLKKSGKLEVLTVNGKAQVIVQDAEAYQKLLEAADLADSVKTLRERLSQPPEKDVPAADMLRRMRRKLHLPEPK
ncbi:MAG TPA: hypothetical protein VN541_08415 [Tepidisphaeraceae bacterium]|nr:hypothetical protein [Tepidisphaeraceae bacterium]